MDGSVQPPFCTCSRSRWIAATLLTKLRTLLAHPVAQPVERLTLGRRATRRGSTGPPGFHTFRRTYGSMLLARGENLLAVARPLGDTVAIVERHYAHLLPDESPPALDLSNLREHCANTRDATGPDSATVKPLRSGTVSGG